MHIKKILVLGLSIITTQSAIAMDNRKVWLGLAAVGVAGFMYKKQHDWRQSQQKATQEKKNRAEFIQGVRQIIKGTMKPGNALETAKITYAYLESGCLHSELETDVILMYLLGTRPDVLHAVDAPDIMERLNKWDPNIYKIYFHLLKSAPTRHQEAEVIFKFYSRIIFYLSSAMRHLEKSLRNTKQDLAQAMDLLDETSQFMDEYIKQHQGNNKKSDLLCALNALLTNQ